MTLTTHAVAGTAVALALQSNPVMAFLAAVASHFLLDAIPHGEYPILSMEKKPNSKIPGSCINVFVEKNGKKRINNKLGVDFLSTGTDFTIGAYFPIFLIQPFSFDLQLSILLGVVGGTLPDGLQFFYYSMKRRPFSSLQKFHDWIHTNKKLNSRPVLAIVSQLSILLIFYGLILVQI